jgi:hypothetical protein
LAVLALIGVAVFDRMRVVDMSGERYLAEENKPAWKKFAKAAVITLAAIVGIKVVVNALG